MKRIVPLLLLVFLSFQSFAKNDKDHQADMKRILPFESCGKNQKVFDFYHLVNAFLDYPGQDPDKPFDRSAPKRPAFVRDSPTLSNIKWHGKHRIWYHWGFNTDFHKFPPLTQSLDDAVSQGVISQTDVQLFWKKMEKEVSTRNKTLMNEAAKVFGFGQLGTISSAQRRQLNALTAICYSIHVVGDYTTTDTVGLAPLKRVYADIFNSIDNLAGKDPDNLAQAKAVKKKLRNCQKTPEAFLDGMEMYFSPFLLSLKGEGYDYRARFEKLGYVLK